MSQSTLIRQLKQVFIICGGGTLTFFGMSIYRGDEKFYENMVMPGMRLCETETAHNIAVKMSRYNVIRRAPPDPPSLKCQVWGKTFSNPVGLAAGFDKQGEAVNGLLRMGFGFVEVGSVTPEPQEGNPKPRVFRLVEDKGVINRYGFNSDGHDIVYNRLKSRDETTDLPITEMSDNRNLLNINFWTEIPTKLNNKLLQAKEKGVMGVNLGKNKTSPSPVEDYAKGVQRFGGLADYLVINVSSPNTPGLRAMQGKQQLQVLIEKVVAERNKLDNKPPLLIKIAPDLTDQEKKDIADIVIRKESGVDGLIVSNTTVTRPPSLHSCHKDETGGLSGLPLKDLSTSTISDMYKLTKGSIPIIGVGGISNGQDAYDKIKAGASLIQLYTALVYCGPPVVKKIKRELSQYLQSDGYASIQEAIGVNNKPK